MSQLRQRMSESGFESNYNYDFEVACLLQSPCPGVRTLDIQGEAGRHKTAFANALANALDYPSIKYFDFSHSQLEEDKEIEHEVMQLGDDKDGKFVPPVKPLDKIMSDACAFSESDPTFVILDQLQIGQFRDHIRIYQFVTEGMWTYPGSQFFANKGNFLLCLISEEPLYHSLQQSSYRIWVHRHAMRNLVFTLDELDLPENANDIVQGLNEMFTDLGVMPTLSEFRLLMADLVNFVRLESQFASAIYARVSGIDRDTLYSSSLQARFKMMLPLLEKAIDIEHLDE